MPYRTTTRQQQIERALDNVAYEPNCGCWLSLSWLTQTGYARISLKGENGKHRLVGLHRVSYAAHKGPIPEGMSVLHKCDVRSCVNPDHLFLGTQADNMADMDRKGRRAVQPRRAPIVVRAPVSDTHCQRGHARTDDNLYVSGNKRRCRACRRLNELRRPARKGH